MPQALCFLYLNKIFLWSDKIFLLPYSTLPFLRITEIFFDLNKFFLSEGMEIYNAGRYPGIVKLRRPVCFIAADPIKVPIIMSDVFRCTVFDLVLDILWSHICLVNLDMVAPLNIKRRCVPFSTPILHKILPHTIPVQSKTIFRSFFVYFRISVVTWK